MLNIKHAFERLKNVLRKINPNMVLPDNFFKYLWDYMEEITPDPDEPLVKQGSIPKFAYFIIRGFISVYYHDEKGNKLVKRFYGEECIVALLSFL
ncbi:cyclic nucleotide-binding domain-containing protein [Pedobacter heparinus]|uniref:cyclic nucleotide-binding domain-containing protein n=1 Tax=Pedobacter heparinus TaxID=984 RepID=UPI002930896D|nr:cyclic nucleotide-binding domain-containing protein [Pedobacter heparinus]